MQAISQVHHWLLLFPRGFIDSWQAKKLTIVSRSSAEAEDRALAMTTHELLWLHGLLTDLQIPVLKPTPLFVDNDAAISIASKIQFNMLELSTLSWIAIL